jgi:hypothetical protein
VAEEEEEQYPHDEGEGEGEGEAEEGEGGEVSDAALSAHREALLQMQAELATCAMSLQRMEWKTNAVGGCTS